jgi:rhamnose transport system substrate-binding protein
VNQATYSAIGGSLVKAMCAEIPGCAGDIAFLSESPDSPNLSQWVAAAKSALKLPIYSKLKVVETAYCGDSDAPCYADTQALMKAHPKLKGIIVPGSVQLAAAARALTDLSLVGKVQMTGLGLPIQLKSYVLSGLMKDVVFWNVINLGYLAEWVEHGLLAGTITPKIGETFRAGKLGSFFVEANHMILLGGTDCKTDLTCGLLLFNKKNIGSVTY